MRKWKFGLGNYLLCWVTPPLPPPPGSRAVSLRNTVDIDSSITSSLSKSQREYCSADRTDIPENTAQLTGLTNMRILLS
jgi:hypothetical protein